MLRDGCYFSWSDQSGAPGKSKIKRYEIRRLDAPPSRSLKSCSTMPSPIGGRNESASIPQDPVPAGRSLPSEALTQPLGEGAAGLETAFRDLLQ